MGRSWNLQFVSTCVDWSPCMAIASRFRADIYALRNWPFYGVEYVHGGAGRYGWERNFCIEALGRLHTHLVGWSLEHGIETWVRHTGDACEGGMAIPYFASCGMKRRRYG